MDIKKISKINIIQTDWSGGSSRQYYIYPEFSNFIDEDFDFRISSALVEVKESVFTNFPNHERILMIIEGEMKISHKGFYEKELKQFDQDQFLGKLTTTASSKGVVVDFNVIFSEKYNAICKYLTIDLFEEFEVYNQWLFIYLVKGDLSVEVGEESFHLEELEMLMVKADDKVMIKLKNYSSSECIVTQIKKTEI